MLSKSRILPVILAFGLCACTLNVALPPETKPSATVSPRPGASASVTAPVSPNPNPQPTAVVSTPTAGQTSSSPPVVVNSGCTLAPSSFVMPNLPLTVTANNVTLRLDKSYYKPGDKIRLSFSTATELPNTAWVGIVPSDVAHGQEEVNDQHDLAYQRLEDRNSAILEFTAPSLEKALDFRLNDSEASGRELVSLSFVVTRELPPEERQAVAIILPKTQFKPGETVKLQFRAPGSFLSSAWLGIVPANVPHGEESENDKFDKSYEYLEGKTSGELSFNMPEEPGSYDFRMHDRDDSGKEACYQTFTVSN
ncbi:MAG: hypothetical protein ACAI44_35600 [Candidatus Sericytochromatia bacterium]